MTVWSLYLRVLASLQPEARVAWALAAAPWPRVQAALDEAMTGHTTFVIAHRLATILSATRILLFENGGIVEAGSFDTLVQQGGRFARLAHMQFMAALGVYSLNGRAVRSCPNSNREAGIPKSTLKANSRLTRRSKRHGYSITSLARASGGGGISRPSAWRS